MDRSGRSVARVRLSFSAIFSPVIGPFFFTISIICSWRFDNSICLHPLHMYYDILYVDLHSYGIYYITTFLPNQCLSCKQIRKKKESICSYGFSQREKHSFSFSENDPLSISNLLQKRSYLFPIICNPSWFMSIGAKSDGDTIKACSFQDFI